MNYWLWRFYVKRPDGQKVLVASHIAGMSPEIVKADLEAGNSFLRNHWEKTFSAPRDPATYLELDAARGQTTLLSEAAGMLYLSTVPESARMHGIEFEYEPLDRLESPHGNPEYIGVVPIWSQGV